MSAYRTIVADPPWPYDSRNPFSVGVKLNGDAPMGVSSVARYGAMSMDKILALRPDAEDDAHLYLWTTNAFMDEAGDVARAWGFEPKTILTYGKVQPDGRPSMKTGYHVDNSAAVDKGDQRD